MLISKGVEKGTVKRPTKQPGKTAQRPEDAQDLVIDGKSWEESFGELLGRR